MQQAGRFEIAAFDACGELVGVGQWATDSLSSDWLALFHDLIETHGATFGVPLPTSQLSHITLRLTSASGAALSTFYSRGELASSAVALTGQNAQAESQLVQTFVDSIKQYAVTDPSTPAEPFSQVFGLAARPLYIAVAWGNPVIPESDQSLVVHLNTHLAAALLATSAAA